MVPAEVLSSASDKLQQRLPYKTISRKARIDMRAFLFADPAEIWTVEYRFVVRQSPELCGLHWPSGVRLTGALPVVQVPL